MRVTSGRVARRLLKGKELRYEEAARAGMLSGVTKLARAVAITLGPRGRNVIMDQMYGSPKITKDGVTVAKSIEFSDKFENMGAQLVRHAASTTNDVAGDGTTTATVLAQAIAVEGHRAVSTGANPIEVKRGIDAAVKQVVADVVAQSRQIKGKAEICQVAVISANGDKEIGEMIATAMDKVGTSGVITTEDGKTLETELQIVEGMSLSKGYASPYFVTNAKTQKCDFDNAFVLVSEKKISSAMDILPCLNYVVRAGRPLLIVADDIDGDALTTLILNKATGKLHVCAVKAPGFGDNKTNILHDLAVYCGAQVISDESGVQLTAHGETFDPTILGSAKKVSVSKDSAVLRDGGGAPAAVSERVDLIKELIAASDSDYDKEKMKERLAKLSGGVAVIKVGGASEVEVGEKKDRVTDALNATRAAVAEGIVAGSGLALLYASVNLRKLLDDPTLSADQKVGVRIIQTAIRRPAIQIINNAGREGGVYVHQMLERHSATTGYDVVADKWVDFFQHGVIDPVLVVKTALQNAASVSSMLLTTECAVVDAPEKADKPAAGAGAMGGMGGGGFGGDFGGDF